MFRPRRLIPVAAAVVSLLAAAAPAGAHYDNPGSKYCGYIVFERGTDSGASASSRRASRA
jgi:hypothetical protein